ncbi:MAG TPA: beta-galactosidase family protein [Acidobacteriaceae bacterium]|nr:beta-galactosidase family protein [Acidobacteriaceae bacterium]
MKLRIRFAALFTFLGLLAPVCLPEQTHPQDAHSFQVVRDHFELDGKPFEVLSGEIHYARVPRQYWRNRIRMARAMGLNTIATYVFWNVHEPRPGVYDFSGQEDLAAFIRIAQEEHMYVLLRAGPYSCAEWEFGGFPAWLLADPRMQTALRSNDPAFMVPVERWMKRLAQEIAPLQIGLGGPIIAVQIENEYGNFGSDKAYMEHLHQIFTDDGFTHSLLYTVDPSKALARGEIAGVYSGVNFGTGHAAAGLDALESVRPGQPLFATEYWPGWFDLWGHPHETRPTAPQIADLNTILGRGASLNIYMVHGGTSFGFMAGASESTGAYRGNVTSYDYDAPIDEAGHPTPKFFAYRDVILKHTNQQPLPIPPVPPVIAVPSFTLTRGESLWDVLPAPVASDEPKTMEQIGQAYGLILYRTRLKQAAQNATLTLEHMQDFAVVYVNGKQVGTLDRHYHQDHLAITAPALAQLDILVENMGRLNSTKKMRDETKGIHDALLDGVPLRGWNIYPLPMDPTPHVNASGKPFVAGPHFAEGSFTVENVGDTFLDTRGLGMGEVWINGHALGRFWDIGPQATLYLPGVWLKKGRNDVVIFELLKDDPQPKLAGLTRPILDAPTPGYANDPERQRKPKSTDEFAPAPGEKPIAPALPH